MRMNSSQFDPTRCVLAANRIDIWQYSLRELFPEAPSLLNDDETARAHRFYFARHQRRFTVARAMLRQILSYYLHCSPKALEFGYNPQGKPSLLENLAHLEFNLSHSGDLALLAVGQRHAMGIDLEYFSKRSYVGIAQQLFSEVEMKALHAVNQCLEPLVFFHIWAQKEAFIKASGLGLSYPTQQFDVPAALPTNQLINDPLHQKNWHMISFMPEVACCAALCHHPSIEQIYYFKI